MKTLILDLETDNVDPLNPKLVGYATILVNEEGRSQHYHASPFISPAIKLILEDPEYLKICHNLKFEYQYLKCMGVNMVGPYYCTMVAAWLANMGVPKTLSTGKILYQYGLKALAEYQLKEREVTTFDDLSKMYAQKVVTGVTKKGKEKIKKVPALSSQIPPEILEKYCLHDVEMTEKLYTLTSEYLEKNGLMPLFTRMEMPVLKILADMELNGVKLDNEYLMKFKHELEDDRVKIETELEGIAGAKINWKSPKQLHKFIYEDLKLPVIEYTANHTASTGVKSLQKLEGMHPVIPLLLKYRKVDKLITTYTDALMEKINEKTKRVHPSFNQIGTETGRFSSSNPNGQQIPKHTEDGLRIRKAFIAEEGNSLISIDFSQIELRVMAHYSGDPKLIEAFTTGKDVHQTVADELGVDRDRTAKSINFGLIYGSTEYGLARTLGISTDAAKAYIDNYFMKFKGVYYWMKRQKSQCAETKYTETIFKRRRPLLDITSGDFKKRMSAERQALNTPIQGCLSGTMRVLTEYGVRELRDLVGKRFKIWDGNNFVVGDCVYSGKKQETRVTFGTNDFIDCSSEHKFLTVDVNGKEKFKRPSEFSRKERVRFSNTSPDFGCKTTWEPEKNSSHWKAPNGVANTHLYSIDDIKNSFNRGLFLGRLVSDGSITNRAIRLFIAEHEKNILSKLTSICGAFRYRVKKIIRPMREPMYYIDIASVLLARQLQRYNVKNRIPKPLWDDKDMLRGFLQGMFDGDGGWCEDIITLTFGKGGFYKKFAEDIQSALTIFGIRSRLRIYPKDRTVVRINKADNEIFLKRIGFLNMQKRARHGLPGGKRFVNPILGNVVTVKSVVTRLKYVKMYDIVNTEQGKYVCEGVIVHNSAADIMKVAMIKVQRMLDTKYPQCKMVMNIHDELVFECPTDIADVVGKEITTTMEQSVNLKVPIKAECEIGKNLGEL
jgi:DNA polymerase I-like protein with 3'-5' exonuclease and polymerase domains